MKKIISIILVITFTLNTCVYGLAPASVNSSLGSNELQQIMAQSHLRLLTAKIGPGAEEALTSDSFIDNDLSDKSEQRSLVEEKFGDISFENVGENYPEEWMESEFFSGNDQYGPIDPKTVTFQEAAKRFLIMECGLTLADSLIFQTMSYRDKLKQGLNKETTDHEIEQILNNTIPLFQRLKEVRMDIPLFLSSNNLKFFTFFIIKLSRLLILL